MDIPDEDAELDIGSGSNLPAVEESISKDTVDTPVPPVAAPRSASSIPVPERKSYPKRARLPVERYEPTWRIT